MSQKNAILTKQYFVYVTCVLIVVDSSLNTFSSSLSLCASGWL